MALKYILSNLMEMFLNKIHILDHILDHILLTNVRGGCLYQCFILIQKIFWKYLTLCV